MIANRSLRFALCAVLLLAPLAALSAQEMGDDMTGNDEGFYLTAAYAAAMPGSRDLISGDTTVAVGTEFGLLGGRFGVGYGVDGFRPELSVGLRTAEVDSLTVAPSNRALAGAGGTVTAVDLAFNVYRDIGEVSDFSMYVGVGGGLSIISANLETTTAGFDLAPYNDSAPALSFQVAVGFGYAATEDLTFALGYRLVGTLEANFSKYSTSKAKTDMTLSHVVEAGLRFSL